MLDYLYAPGTRYAYSKQDQLCDVCDVLAVDGMDLRSDSIEMDAFHHHKNNICRHLFVIVVIDIKYI